MRYDELRDYLKQQMPSNDVEMKYIYARNNFNGAAKYFIDGLEAFTIYPADIKFGKSMYYSIGDFEKINELLQTPLDDRLTEDIRHKQERIDQRA